MCHDQWDFDSGDISNDSDSEVDALSLARNGNGGARAIDSDGPPHADL